MEVGTRVTITAKDFNGEKGTVIPNEIGDDAIWVEIAGNKLQLPFAKHELEQEG